MEARELVLEGQWLEVLKIEISTTPILHRPSLELCFGRTVVC